MTLPVLFWCSSFLLSDVKICLILWGISSNFFYNADLQWINYPRFCLTKDTFQFSLVQLLSCVWLFATPWTATCQPSLSITNSQSLFKLMSIESVMPSNHVILCYPLLFLPSMFPNIRVFSNESVLHIRWLKYWNFSFSV